MNRYRRLAISLLVTAMPAAVAGSILPVNPATAAPAGSPRLSETTVTVVASGLNNPRGIILGPLGTLLVAEAGTGGSGSCITDPEGGYDLCLGRSGSISLLKPSTAGRWHNARIVTGVPSLATADGSFANGLHNVAFGAHGLLGTVGLGGTPAIRDSLGADARLLGQVVRFGPGGRLDAFADLAVFEEQHNPDSDDVGSIVSSGPYGLVGTEDGAIATDTAGNTLLSIDSRGRVRPLAVFHAEQVPAPTESGGTAAAMVWMQAVPITAVRGPDSAYYVGAFTGFPYPVGGAKVWRVVPGHPPTVWASGFTNIIDIAFDRSGRLLVLEMMKNGRLSGDPAGALIRVERDGSRTELAPGAFTFPGGLAVTRDAIYVTNNSIYAGTGAVLRIPQ
jgi:hypothetical protein